MKKDTPPLRLSPETSPEIVLLLRNLGIVVQKTSVYGADHPAARSAVREACDTFEVCMAGRSQLDLAISDGQLIVDGAPVSNERVPLAQVLAARMVAMGIPGITLLNRMGRHEFRKLLIILAADPKVVAEEGGFADLIATNQFSGVKVRKITYRAVDEDEEIVRQRGAGSGAAHVEISQITAFLRGDVEQATPEVRQAIHSLASDAEQLADLILKASIIKPSQAHIEGESLADLVVSCLRRSFGELSNAQDAQTQKGRKNLKKTVLLLEKSIVDHLHKMAANTDPALDDAIAAEVEKIVDELEIDALTSEYMKKRNALEKAETRILRYMRSHGDETHLGDLADHMASEGLPLKGWKQLVVQAGASTAAGGGTGTDMPDIVNSLAVLLVQLDKLMREKNQGGVGACLDDIDQEMHNLSGTTDQKIQAIKQEIEIGDSESSQGGKQEDCRNIRALMAETVQELCQFVAAINCSVTMVYDRRLGELTDEQSEMLGVAGNCGEQLDELLHGLIKVVGVPASLAPARDAIYEAFRDENS